jgi:hypothetical protein
MFARPLAICGVALSLLMGALVMNSPVEAASAKQLACEKRASRLKSRKARAVAKKKCVDPSTSVLLPTTGPQPVTASPVPLVGNCQMFPVDNPWNQRVDLLPLHPQSEVWVSTLGRTRTLHPDFGGPYGIPFVVVPASQVKVPITFTAYGDESDPGPYPIPLSAPIEGGINSDGDRHVLALQSGSCKLFELGRAFPTSSGWNADVGAVFDLSSNALRPERWTSADAAGLPILAGLVRYEDIADGVLRHAVRFTAQCTQRAYVHPATHQAGKDNPACAPMGARFRLKSSFDTTAFTGQTRIILEGLKIHGMLVADNGSNWFITGSSDARWNVEDLEQLKRVPGGAFEVVDTGPLLK